jgi:hypothetical protein
VRCLRSDPNGADQPGNTESAEKFAFYTLAQSEEDAVADESHHVSGGENNALFYEKSSRAYFW